MFFLFIFNAVECIVLAAAAALFFYARRRLLRAARNSGEFRDDATDEAQRLRAWKNHIYPLAVFASSLQDKTLLQRANDERERLKTNRNPYDDLVPICVFYPNTLFSMFVGKEQITADFIGLPYLAYLTEAQKTYQRIHAAWMRELQKQEIATEDEIAQLVNGQVLAKKAVSYH